MVTIDNKFNGISIEPLNKSSKSDIKVRVSYNPFRLGGPIAIVKCGSCKETYKHPLTFLWADFCMKQDNLQCKCGYTDYIKYRRNTK